MPLLIKNGKPVMRNGKPVTTSNAATCDCCGGPVTCCNGGGCCVSTDATSSILLERKVFQVEVAGDHVADLLTSGYTVTSEAGTRFSLSGLVNEASLYPGSGDDFCGIFSTTSGAFDSWLDTGSRYEWVAQPPVRIAHSTSVIAEVYNDAGNVYGATAYIGSGANFDLFADGDPTHRCCGIPLHERTYVVDAYYDELEDKTFGTIAYHKNSTTVSGNKCCNCGASCTPTSDASLATCDGTGINKCTTAQGADCCLMTCAVAPSAVAVDILAASAWEACAGAVAPMTLGSWDGTLARTCTQDGGGVLTSLSYVRSSNIATDSTATAFGLVALTWLISDCKFRLRYTCGATVIWEGEKLTSLNGPLGTYTRTAGTDTTPTRSVT